MTEPSKVLHIRNVGPETSEHDLLQLAQSFGVVQKVVMLRAKNQALLQMQDIPSAINVMHYYPTVQSSMRGRKLYMQFSSHQELTTMDQLGQMRQLPAEQAYTLPSVHYPPINPPLPQYARGQEAPPLPMYLVHHQPVYQYSAVGVPSEVLGNPIQPMPVAAMAVPSISGYPPQGWAAPSTPVWGYGLDRVGGYAHEQEQRMSSNWPLQPPQGRPVNGGNGGGGNGGASSNFHRRVEGYGHPQGFTSTSGGEGWRHDRGMDSHGSSQHTSASLNWVPMARQPPPTSRSPADLQVKSLSCEPCEKTFQIPSQLAAHMNTHVVCEEIGCSFSASGKVVKLHKETAHCKSSHANSSAAHKGASISGESNEEIRSWREERKRNYPTRTNVQRKKDEMEGRLARGELIDEDSRRRKQRMKEILAKQAELGVPVAEVPAYYLSQSHKDQRPGSKEKNNRFIQNHKEIPSTTGYQSSISNNVSESKKRKQEVVVEGAANNDSQLVKVARVNEDSVIGQNISVEVGSTELSPKPLPVDSQVTSIVHSESGIKLKVEDEEEAGVNPMSKSSKQQCYFYQRGRCKKGAKCHYAHTGPRNKKGGDGEATRGGRGNQKGGAADKKRPLTLLSKLLESSILRDKSYILQCLRYFVNNNFLVDWPNQPAKVSDLDLEEDTSCENNLDNSDGEVVEEPDVLAADSAIINCLLSERPEVLADVLNGNDNAEMECEA